MSTDTLGAEASSATSTVALRYARQMFDRQREPLPPVGFEVNWADRPSHHKLYLGATKVPLPEPFATVPETPLDEAYASAAAGPAEQLPSLSVIASALACGAVVDRHVALNWNDDSRRKQRPVFADWSRPTASGGGMYPTESYLVVGAGSVLPAGVYHYDTAHHALDLVTATDRTPALARATGVAATAYLVGTARLWKNSFKYNSFCYHVVTQDTGALLASWRLVLGAAGVPVRPRLWFDQGEVAAAVGVDGSQEPPFVVVPLGGAPEDAALAGGATLRCATTPLPRSWERSRWPRTFPLVEEVNAATWVASPAPDPVEEPGHPAVCPAPLPPSRLVAPPVPLPGTPWRQAHTLQESLVRRHSAFGTFSSRPAVRLAQLGGVLQVLGDASRLTTDLAGPGRDPWVRTWVVAAHVDGLAQGGYAYDHDTRQLLPVRLGRIESLQQSYPLQNYDTGQVAAMLVLSGRLGDLVSRFGDAGYRFLSLEVGQAAQTAYLGATAVGLGVGAVLGVDNVTVNDWLGLDAGEESMLCVFLGVERPQAGYDHRIPTRTPVPGRPADRTYEEPA